MLYRVFAVDSVIQPITQPREICFGNEWKGSMTQATFVDPRLKLTHAQSHHINHVVIDYPLPVPGLGAEVLNRQEILFNTVAGLITHRLLFYSLIYLAMYLFMYCYFDIMLLSVAPVKFKTNQNRTRIACGSLASGARSPLPIQSSP